MIEGFNHPPSPLRKRDASGFATTVVTNEIVSALMPSHYGEPGVVFLPSRPYIIKITDEETGSEKYTCEAYTASKALLDPAQSVAADDAALEDRREFANAVYVNLQGVGSSGHSLTHADNTNQKYFIGFLMGYTSESPPRAVFIGNALWTTACP